MNHYHNQYDAEDQEEPTKDQALKLFTRGMLCGILFGLLTHILL